MPEIARQRGNAHRRANHIENSCLIRACVTRAICTCVWRKIMKQLGLGVIVAIGLTLPAFAHGVDPLIGTWKLNLEKSTRVGFRSLTLTWSGEGKNFIDTADGVTAQGQSFHVIFRHIYDGQPHPTTGSSDYDLTGQRVKELSRANGCRLWPPALSFTLM
jgi:hypothetical protein